MNGGLRFLDTNKLILWGTLKSSFDFVTYHFDENGQEICKSFKQHKKSFLEKLKDEKISVKLVDKYPESFENNILYVRKDGRTVWYKEMA